MKDTDYVRKVVTVESCVLYIDALEEENEKLKNSLEVMTDAYDIGVKSRDRMRTEKEKLKECVEFYADFDSWDEYHLNEPQQCIKDSDFTYALFSNGIGGKKARKTIEEISSNKEQNDKD